MLAALKVRDIVLIHTLDLEFKSGLSVLTGETGAGKTIILDALGLALGERADRALVRPGAGRGTVSATFELDEDHAALNLAAGSGLSVDGALILRRVIEEDGKSRAFINDEPVTLALLRAIGRTLVEVHGQNDDRGLLDSATHRALLDAFAGLEDDAVETVRAYHALRAAEEALTGAKSEAAALRAEAEALAEAEASLTALDPRPGEEASLSEQRSLMSNAGKIVEAVNEALGLLDAEGGIAARLAQATRGLERVKDKAAQRLEPALDAFDRASIELAEARAALHELGAALVFDPAQFEAIEERLHALRAAARKHNVSCDGLSQHLSNIKARRAAMAESDEQLEGLREARLRARDGYLKHASALSAKRKAAAHRLDQAIARELGPLKLDKATFRTAIETCGAEEGGPSGLDRVSFLVSTNPDAPLGALSRIASGGELARFMLALKVVIAHGSSAQTLIFDEVDHGIGGAVANAVGERLARLGEASQVIVVTHSPQVAARAAHHFRVTKGGKDSKTVQVDTLDGAATREEIARMLAGASITDEARAAAGRLIADTGKCRARS
jgi:DNA repair protein RecN (Recombination protein N)